MEKPDHLYEYLAAVRSVYDGDTVRLDIDLGFRTWIRDEPVRLAGINAPEVRGPEREEGLRTRDWLRERLEGHETVMIRTMKDARGKYGRWLADLRVFEEGEWRSLNVEMVDLGLAVRAVY